MTHFFLLPRARFKRLFLPIIRLSSTSLTKTEAEELITNGVKTELSRHIKRFLKILGVTTVAALVTLILAMIGTWFAVEKLAESAAIGASTTAATGIASSAVGHALTVMDATFANYLARLDDADKKRIVFENGMTATQKRFDDLSKGGRYLTTSSPRHQRQLRKC